MATALPLNSGAPDADELAKMSKHEEPAVSYGRAASTAPKGKRPATKSEEGQQGTTAPTIALKGCASTERASAAGALYAEEEMPAKNCSARAAGQGVQKGPAKRDIKKKRGGVQQKQS